MILWSLWIICIRHEYIFGFIAQALITYFYRDQLNEPFLFSNYNRNFAFVITFTLLDAPSICMVHAARHDEAQSHWLFLFSMCNTGRLDCYLYKLRHGECVKLHPWLKNISAGNTHRDIHEQKYAFYSQSGGDCEKIKRLRRRANKKLGRYIGMRARIQTTREGIYKF